MQSSRKAKQKGGKGKETILEDSQTYFGAIPVTSYTRSHAGILKNLHFIWLDEKIPLVWSIRFN